MTFDPRTISKPVFNALQELYLNTGDDSRRKEQKNQALELYTYLSTWGMMRLKAEETTLNQEGKKEVVAKYFQCLEELSQINNLSNSQGLTTLKDLSTDDYLGLTGLGLEIAQEFSFWANAIYCDVESGD
ncbi:CRISPR type III-B/RAMP module-associated protein Cmr5 [Microcystis aeruginosa]